MSKHRITRQEMKHDEFVSIVGHATRWAEDNWRIVAGIFGGLVALALITLAVLQWQEGRRLKAEAALARVTAAFHANLGDVVPGDDESFATIEEKARAVVERADAVIESYGSTPAGIRARYYRALALDDGGDPAAATDALDAFIRSYPNSFLAPFAEWKRAQIRERSGDRAAACEDYRKLLDVQVPEFPNEVAYMDLGRCLDESGDPVAAVETYRRMLDEYPESMYAGDARQRIARLDPDAG